MKLLYARSKPRSLRSGVNRHKEQVTVQIVFYLQFEGVQVSKIVRVSEGGGVHKEQSKCTNCSI